MRVFGAIVPNIMGGNPGFFIATGPSEYDAREALERQLFELGMPSYRAQFLAFDPTTPVKFVEVDAPNSTGSQLING